MNDAQIDILSIVKIKFCFLILTACIIGVKST